MTAGKSLSGRILVVDDQSANLRVVSSLLARDGYEVATAESGARALEQLQAQAPDLMLLDMLMPGMDGFELLAEVRSRDDLPQPPTIFLTAAQDRELLLRAFEAGAVDYVTKPFMPEELLARVNAHLGLKLTRDRLERVARERQELVNLVAHDLKNPLTSVHFACQMLLSGSARPERVPRYVQMIHESTQDAFGYIRRYLETQQDAAAGVEDGPAPRACLGDMLDWLAARYSLQLEERGARLCVSGSGDEAAVAIDPLVLRQVCENLISNALKYAPDGDVEISVVGGGPGFWHLRVEDRGPGIPKQRQAGLFTPFFRIAETARDDGVSSGLGLSLARQIIGNAGGQLWYEDREGGGARFVIALPEAPPGSGSGQDGI